MDDKAMKKYLKHAICAIYSKFGCIMGLQMNEGRGRCKLCWKTCKNYPKWMLEWERRKHQYECHTLPGEEIRIMAIHLTMPPLNLPTSGPRRTVEDW